MKTYHVYAQMAQATDELPLYLATIQHLFTSPAPKGFTKVRSEPTLAGP